MQVLILVVETKWTARVEEKVGHGREVGAGGKEEKGRLRKGSW